jgi:DNA polymerase-3 subunit epsilon
MLNNITLHRPLAIIDVETTGTHPQQDRIVEICILKVRPDGSHYHWTRRINPGIPIPPEAITVHGITDADVVGAPRFADVAESLLTLVQDCDLCGFNLRRFDLRVLAAECLRAGRQLSLDGRAVLDVMDIFHRYEPRDLAAAVRFYLHRPHDGAHSASKDVSATAEVLDAMVGRYTDLPSSIDDLHRRFRDQDAVDIDGCFIRVDGQIRFAFGKHRGRPLDAVAATEPDYLRWMLGQTFLEDTQAVVRDARARAVACRSNAACGASTPAGQ